MREDETEQRFFKSAKCKIKLYGAASSAEEQEWPLDLDSLPCHFPPSPREILEKSHIHSSNGLLSIFDYSIIRRSTQSTINVELSLDIFAIPIRSRLNRISDLSFPILTRKKSSIGYEARRLLWQILNFTFRELQILWTYLFIETWDPAT